MKAFLIISQIITMLGVGFVTLVAFQNLLVAFLAGLWIGIFTILVAEFEG